MKPRNDTQTHAAKSTLDLWIFDYEWTVLVVSSETFYYFQIVQTVDCSCSLWSLDLQLETVI